MQPTDDSALLRQYAEDHSEEAFAALVTRHVNLVYSVALRHVGNPHNAEEITQAVFAILAKKAAQLRHDRALSSWLFQATRLTANNFLRSETRRHRREEEAHMQSILDESGSELWPKIAPWLDAAVADLREKDRQAIVLRYYEGRNLREVGLALGASEDAAEKRVSRALETLRKFFLKRGVDSTTVIIAGAISVHSVQVAPAVLAKSVTAVALAQGAAASGSTLTLIQGALKLMAWTKIKTAVVVGASLLVVGGTTTVVVKKVERARVENRLADLRLRVWPEERKQEAERIQSRQEIDETINATTINLRPYINARLTDGPAGWKGDNDDNLTELPAGKHIYAGVPFDVAGSIQLTGGWLKRHYHKNYPVQVGDIRIDRTCAKLHLLHGDYYLVYTNFGTVVSKLVLHYVDGSTRELDLVAGENSFDWWHPLFKSGLPESFLHLAPGTERAWTGSNPYIRKWQPELSLILYKTTFDNPQPDVKLASVDFVSSETVTCPFLVGLTVE